MRRMPYRKAMFIKEFLIDLNAAAATKRAGYSVRTSRGQPDRLMKDPEIRAAIQEEMDRRAKRVELTADYILDTIRDTIERCSQAKPVLDKKGRPVYIEGPFGEEVPAYTFDSGAVLKGCELLGRHLKLFTDKFEITGDIQLAERIKAARERAGK